MEIKKLKESVVKVRKECFDISRVSIWDFQRNTDEDEQFKTPYTELMNNVLKKYDYWNIFFKKLELEGQLLSWARLQAEKKGYVFFLRKYDSWKGDEDGYDLLVRLALNMPEE